MKPVRFTLHFAAESDRARTVIANYCVYGAPIGIHRLDEHPERNFATLAGLLAALAPAKISDLVAEEIERALKMPGGEYVCEVSEEQAAAVGLGF